jgi:group I intron endonuclease
MSSIYSIYKATNTINGKVYIGFDSNWPKRKKRHLSDSSNEKSKGFNDIFHKAIRKYGKENFDWQIIYQSKDGKHCLKSMEEYFIKENNSYIYFNNSNGYNMTLGGEGMLGFKHSEKSKIKNSVSSGKNFKVWHKDGELIEENHIKYFCVKNNLDYDSFKKLLHNKLFSYKGYYPYNNENNIAEALKKYNQRIKKSMEIMGSKHSKTYKLLSPNNELITINNLAKFARDNNLNPQSLKQVVMGKLKSNKGWKLP